MSAARPPARAQQQWRSLDRADHLLRHIVAERTAAEHHVLHHLDEDRRPGRTSRSARTPGRGGCPGCTPRRPATASPPTRLRCAPSVLHLSLARAADRSHRAPRPHRRRSAARHRFPTCARCPATGSSSPPGSRTVRPPPPPRRHCRTRCSGADWMPADAKQPLRFRFTRRRRPAARPAARSAQEPVVAWRTRRHTGPSRRSPSPRASDPRAHPAVRFQLGATFVRGDHRQDVEPVRIAVSHLVDLLANPRPATRRCGHAEEAKHRRVAAILHHRLGERARSVLRRC